MDVDGERKPRTEGLAIALLDFPKGGTFGLDGQSIVTRTGDFLGVRDVPPNAFHLVTCKNGIGSSVDGSRNDAPNTVVDTTTAVTVGFLVYGDDGSGGGGENNNVRGRHLVRRYDPRTEEVASEEHHAVDELTRRNLVQQLTNGSLPPSRVLRYDQIVGGGSVDGTNDDEPVASSSSSLSQQRMWREQTRYIHDPSPGESRISLLSELRNLPFGVKIVPGCYDPEDETKTRDKPEKETDGRTPAYPPIPVVDPGMSLARHKHTGTNRFLSGLAPRERTRLFLAASAGGAPSFVWLDRVLKDHYRGSWKVLLGDLQLSYVLFLYLGCYASLEHWKDLLAMLSLAVDGVGEGRRTRERSEHAHEPLYRGLLRLLPYQISSMNDPEFLENLDEGDGNFLLPSLSRLKRYYETETRTVGTEDEEEQELLSKLRHVLSSKFPLTFPVRPSLPTITRIRSNSDGSDMDHGRTGGTAPRAMDIDATKEEFCWGEDDEDGPVIVSSGEIEAAMARTSARVGAGAPREAVTERLRRDYPLLAAAVMPCEDVLMTCARALDERTDVSLVREAAAYLQEVEDRRGFF